MELGAGLERALAVHVSGGAGTGVALLGARESLLVIGALSVFASSSSSLITGSLSLGIG